MTRGTALARTKSRHERSVGLASKSKRSVDHSGSTLDSLLEEDGILAEVEAVAVKRVIAW